MAAATNGRGDSKAFTVRVRYGDVVSFLFWSLVIVTLVVSARWGAMIGLIGFVFALLLGAVAVSRWAPPGAASSDRHVVFRAPVDEAPISRSDFKLTRR